MEEKKKSAVSSKTATAAAVKSAKKETPEAAEAAVSKEKVTPKKSEIETPGIDQLLNAGVHFGHKTSRWNPKMKEYIYDTRNAIHIIDIIKTIKKLKEALPVIQDAADNGNVLIVGTKGQASTAVREVAREFGAYYVDTRWPGGLFTNFDVVKKSLEKLISMEEHLAKGAEDMVKKEQLLMKKEVERLNIMYNGLKFMDKLPTVLIVIDSRIEKLAIREARVAGVKTVALVDTNCDPNLVDYAIPANDDSIKSIKLFIDLFGKAIKGGKRAEALMSLRKNYEAGLASMEKEHADEVARKAAMEEEERTRFKALRQGVTQEKEEKKVVRVAKK